MNCPSRLSEMALTYESNSLKQHEFLVEYINMAVALVSNYSVQGYFPFLKIMMAVNLEFPKAALIHNQGYQDSVDFCRKNFEIK